MKCVTCGTESDGNFCPTCGTSLRPDTCAACGSERVPGAAFCTQCGAPTQGAVATPAGRVPMSASRARRTQALLGGALILAIGAIVAVPLLLRDDASPAAPGMPAAGSNTMAPFADGGAGGATPPPLSANMRENADRLFDRVARAGEAGDSAEARRFAPMALQAYEMAEPLDADGLYHVAMIHLMTGDAANARAVAERLLGVHPQHLLGLGIAAEASAAAGDAAAEAEYDRRFREAWPEESMATRPEYQSHSDLLPAYRDAAGR